jgi:hypothetical protein
VWLFLAVGIKGCSKNRKKKRGELQSWGYGSQAELQTEQKSSLLLGLRFRGRAMVFMLWW